MFVFFPMLEYVWDSLVVCSHDHVWCRVWTTQLKPFKGDRSLCNLWCHFCHVCSFYWRFISWWCWSYTKISSLSFLLICLLFKSVLGHRQGLQNPRGLPHRLHSYWSVHRNLHSLGFSLSTAWEDMSRNESRGGSWRECGLDSMWEYLCICSGLLQAPFHQSIK